MSFMSWFYKSFYQIKVIAYSRFRPITHTLGHIMLLVLIASLPYLVMTNITIYKAVHQLKETIHIGLPAFSIENGQLLLESEDTYVEIDHDQLGSLILDPEGHITENDDLKDEGAIIFSKQAITWLSSDESYNVSYALLGLHNVTASDVIERIDQLHSFLPLLLFIISLFLFIILAGSAYLGVTILASIALLLRQNRKLEYRHMWSICAHAITLPTVVFFWIDTLIIHFHFLWYLLFSIAMIVLSIRAIPLPRSKEAVKKNTDN